MPSIYDIKPGFQKLLRPITKFLAGKGITPNQVTVAAAVLSISRVFAFSGITQIDMCFFCFRCFYLYAWP